MTQVHIVGGGIAGAALAAFLPRHWTVHLHEANWDARQVPTLFGIQSGGRRTLSALGLAEEADSMSVEISGGKLTTPEGESLAAMNDVNVQLISRTDLLALLRRNLPGNVEVHRHGVDCPQELKAELVIGADGVHSTVRQRWWGTTAAPRWLNVTVIRGVIDTEIEGGTLQEIWRPGGLFGMTPRPGGGVNWFATVPRRRFDSRSEALNILRERWNEPTTAPREVLSYATPDLTLVNDLWESRRLTRLYRGPAVLVGDAAHAMTPNLGRGANESLTDALVLGQALNSLPLDQALKRYQRKRLLPPQLIKAASRLTLRLSATHHVRLRNTAFKALPSRA